MMPQRDADAEHWRSSLGLFAVAAFWVALAGGVLEVVILAFEKQRRPLLLRVSEDVVWMAPLALIVVTCAATVPCVLLGRVWRPRWSLALALFASSTLVTLGLLMLIPGLSHYAALLLAAGLAAQTTRFALRHTAGTCRVALWSTPVLIGALALTSAGLWPSSPTGPTAASARPAQTVSPLRQSPNVLLITLDTARAANLSLYGYHRQTTPALDRFAERGVVFDKAFATASWTLPSHASLFTGRWPHELSADYESPLDGTYLTLAEYLAGRGYATAGFVANLGYCGRDTGLARGFSHYEDYPRTIGQIASSSTLVRKVADNFNLRRLIENDEHLNRISAEQLNEHVLAWLSAREGSPFFVFVNYFDAHEPYLPPPPFDRQFGPGRRHGKYSPLRRWLWEPAVAHGNMGVEDLREEIDAYDGALAYLDTQIGRLLDQLSSKGLLDNTLVVITADHGEEFAEHAVYEHGYSLYRAGVQVPLIVVFPGHVPARRRIPQSISLRDIPATIADTIAPGGGSPFPGESLAVLWDPQSQPGRQDTDEALLSELTGVTGQPDWFPASKGDMKAVVYGGLRYIRNGDGSEELYDVEADPLEKYNIISMPDHQPAVAHCRRLIDGIRSGVDAR